MATTPDPASWVDDISALLKKMPPMQNGSPAADGSASTPVAASDDSAAPAAADSMAEAGTPDDQVSALATPPLDALSSQAGQPATATGQTAAPHDPAAEPEQASAPAVEQPTGVQAAAGAASGESAAPAVNGSDPGTPAKAQQPAPAPSLETPAAVRSLTGVAEGFQDLSRPAATSQRSVADVVAASVADAAPAPEDEKQFDTFQEAVGEELQMAKAASDAAKALGTPGAADDILAQMSGSQPGTPEPAAVTAAEAAAAGSTAKDAPAGATSAPAAEAPKAAEPDQTAVKADAGSASSAQDASPKDSQPAPATAVAAADSDNQAAAEPAKPAEASTTEAVGAPTAAPTEASTAAAAAAVSAAATESSDDAKPELGSPAAPGPVAAPAAPATPEATPPMNGSSESPATPELTRRSSSIAERIVAYKSSPQPPEKPASTPQDLLPAPTDGGSTPNSVKARIAAMRRSSETLEVGASPRASIPLPSPSASPTRRWSVGTPKSPSRGPASGEVVAETAKPKAELKSFWEAHSPADGGTPISPPRRSTAENSNAGRKWQVKLNVPLASGKVSDLSYFKKSEPSEASPPPPPPEYKHKIGEATFPLEELRGMNSSHDIDPANKEMYLTDEEFQSSFKMDKVDFQGKPKWRQVLLKKQVGVF